MAETETQQLELPSDNNASARSAPYHRTLRGPMRMHVKPRESGASTPSAAVVVTDPERHSGHTDVDAEAERGLLLSGQTPEPIISSMVIAGERVPQEELQALLMMRNGTRGPMPHAFLANNTQSQARGRPYLHGMVESGTDQGDDAVVPEPAAPAVLAAGEYRARPAATIDATLRVSATPPPDTMSPQGGEAADVAGRVLVVPGTARGAPAMVDSNPLELSLATPREESDGTAGALEHRRGDSGGRVAHRFGELSRPPNRLPDEEDGVLPLLLLDDDDVIVPATEENTNASDRRSRDRRPATAKRSQHWGGTCIPPTPAPPSCAPQFDATMIINEGETHEEELSPSHCAGEEGPRLKRSLSAASTRDASPATPSPEQSGSPLRRQLDSPSRRGASQSPHPSAVALELGQPPRQSIAAAVINRTSPAATSEGRTAAEQPRAPTRSPLAQALLSNVVAANSNDRPRLFPPARPSAAAHEMFSSVVGHTPPKHPSARVMEVGEEQRRPDGPSHTKRRVVECGGDGDTDDMPPPPPRRRMRKEAAAKVKSRKVAVAQLPLVEHSVEAATPARRRESTAGSEKRGSEGNSVVKSSLRIPKMEVGMLVEARWLGRTWYDAVIEEVEEGGILATVRWESNNDTTLLPAKDVRLRRGAVLSPGQQVAQNDSAAPELSRNMGSATSKLVDMLGRRAVSERPSDGKTLAATDARSSSGSGGAQAILGATQLVAAMEEEDRLNTASSFPEKACGHKKSHVASTIKVAIGCNKSSAARKEQELPLPFVCHDTSTSSNGLPRRSATAATTTNGSAEEESSSAAATTAITATSSALAKSTAKTTAPPTPKILFNAAPSSPREELQATAVREVLRRLDATETPSMANNHNDAQGTQQRDGDAVASQASLPRVTKSLLQHFQAVDASSQEKQCALRSCYIFVVDDEEGLGVPVDDASLSFDERGQQQNAAGPGPPPSGTKDHRASENNVKQLPHESTYLGSARMRQDRLDQLSLVKLQELISNHGGVYLRTIGELIDVVEYVSEHRMIAARDTLAGAFDAFDAEAADGRMRIIAVTTSGDGGNASVSRVLRECAALALGVPIVSLQWIRTSVSLRRPANLTPSQIAVAPSMPPQALSGPLSYGTRPLHGRTVMVASEHRDEDLELVLKAAGATVTISPGPPAQCDFSVVTHSGEALMKSANGGIILLPAPTLNISSLRQLLRGELQLELSGDHGLPRKSAREDAQAAAAPVQEEVQPSTPAVNSPGLGGVQRSSKSYSNANLSTPVHQRLGGRGGINSLVSVVGEGGRSSHRHQRFRASSAHESLEPVALEFEGYRVEIGDDFYVLRDTVDRTARTSRVELARVVAFPKVAAPGAAPLVEVQLYRFVGFSLQSGSAGAGTVRKETTVGLDEERIIVPVTALDLQTPLFIMEEAAMQHVYVLAAPMVPAQEPVSLQRVSHVATARAGRAIHDEQSDGRPSGAGGSGFRDRPTVATRSAPQLANDGTPPRENTPFELAVPDQVMWVGGVVDREEALGRQFYSAVRVNGLDVAVGDYVRVLYSGIGGEIGKVTRMFGEKKKPKSAENSPSMMHAKQYQNMAEILIIDISDGTSLADPVIFGNVESHSAKADPVVVPVGAIYAVLHTASSCP